MKKKASLISLSLIILCVISLFSFEFPLVQAEPVLIDSYVEGNYSADRSCMVNHPSTSGSDSAGGQSFTSADEVRKIVSVKFYLKKVGSPTGNAHAVLYAHSGTYGTDGKPTGEPLATSDDFDVSTLTTSYQLITFTFSGDEQYSMSADTYYCIVYENPSSGITYNYHYVKIGIDSSSSTHDGLYFYFRDGVWYAVSSFDMIFYVYGEVLNNAPINDSCTITDMDDSNNLYAQISGGYTVDYDGHDEDGYVDIDYVLVNITQAATVRVSFKYTNSTNTFSIIDGGSEFTLDGSSSASRAGNNINLTIVFHVQWDATEESDLELKAVIVDSSSASDTDIMQTDYADIITNLVVSGFACNDDRGDVGQALTFSGTVYYANNPASSTATTFYPPDAEFSAIHIYDSGDNDEGNDETVVNGAFAVIFNAPASVGTDTYNSYIDMSDEDYSDAEETPSDTFITDRIIPLSLSSNDTAIPVNEYVEVYFTGKLEYDDHALGSGDSLIIESLALSWDAGESRFEGSETKASAQTKTYDEGIGSEATYGITVVNMDIYSLTVEWYEAEPGEGYEAGWFGVGLGILILCFSVGGLIFIFGLRGKR